MSDNPLATPRPSAPQPKADPTHRHAMIWAHVQQQPQDALQKHVSLLDYSLPIVGQLAGNPNVTAKNIIKAVANAVADQKLDPSQGVAMISQIPPDADKVQPWLRQLYADQLSMAVEAKAALMRQAMPGGPPGAPQAAPPMGAPNPAAAAPAPSGMPAASAANPLQPQGPMR